MIGGKLMPGNPDGNISFNIFVNTKQKTPLITGSLLFRGNQILTT